MRSTIICTLRWVGHVARMGAMEDIHENLGLKPEGNESVRS